MTTPKEKKQQTDYLKISDIDFSELKFTAQRKTTGVRFIEAKFNKKPIGIRLPRLRIPFDPQVNRYGQIEFNVSLGTDENLINKFTELDEKMVEFADANSWVGESVEYCPTLKSSRNGDYPPTLRIKIPRKDDTVSTVFFDEKKNRLDVESNEDILKTIGKGKYVLCAIECGRVWLNNERYGMAWTAEHIRLMEAPPRKPQPQTDEYAFLDSSDSESPSEAAFLDDD
jgi:hypothetical protein